MDLAQLLHQVILRVQAPGRVDDDDVAAARLRRRDRVERDGRRVAAALRGDEIGPSPLRPCLQLLARGRAERVGRADHAAQPGLAQMVGDLPD